MDNQAHSHHSDQRTPEHTRRKSRADSQDREPKNPEQDRDRQGRCEELKNTAQGKDHQGITEHSNELKTQSASAPTR